MSDASVWHKFSVCHPLRHTWIKAIDAKTFEHLLLFNGNNFLESDGDVYDGWPLKYWKYL